MVGIQGFIHPSFVPSKSRIPGPKRGALQISPKIHNGNFLENGSNDFDQISIVYGIHNLHRWYLQKNIGMHTRGPSMMC
jgi:hypothetical protein